MKFKIQLKKNELNFLHSGNLGDLIYCLPVIKHLSTSHKCNFFIKTKEIMPVEYLNIQLKAITLMIEC